MRGGGGQERHRSNAGWLGGCGLAPSVTESHSHCNHDDHFDGFEGGDRQDTARGRGS